MIEKINDKSTIIVFDTNVLLRLYMYQPEYVDFAIKCLKVVKENVVIPYQVCNEIKRHRGLRSISVKKYDKEILNCNQGLDKCEKTLKGTLYNLKNIQEFDEIQQLLDCVLDRFNSLRSDIHLFFDEYKKEFDIINQSNLFDDVDTIIDEYCKNAFQQFTEEELQSIYKEGEERYTNDPPQPPGYKDIGKRNKKNYVKNSEYGDLVIWKEIIKYAKNNNIDIIFVINDDKEDWKNKDTFDLRKELIDEFNRETNHSIFSISSRDFYSEVAEKYNIKKTQHVEHMINMKNNNYCRRIAEIAFDKIRGDIEDKIESRIESEHIDRIINPEYNIVDINYEDYNSIDECNLEDIYYLLFSVSVEVVGHEILYEDKDELPFEIYDKSHIELQGTVEVGVSIEHNDSIDIVKDNKFSYAFISDMFFEETGYTVSKNPFFGLESIRHSIDEYQNKEKANNQLFIDKIKKM